MIVKINHRLNALAYRFVPKSLILLGMQLLYRPHLYNLTPTLNKHLEPGRIRRFCQPFPQVVSLPVLCNHICVYLVRLGQPAAGFGIIPNQLRVQDIYFISFGHQVLASVLMIASGAFHQHFGRVIIAYKFYKPFISIFVV
jgi:hypothetical protein